MKRFVVAESSMAPTLNPGDYLLAMRLQKPRSGDIVVFEHHPGYFMVKRIVAVAGDKVEIDQGSVFVNGAPERSPGYGLTYPSGIWIVGEEEVFVLSDNREATSADSRTFGPIQAVGSLKVRFRYWPHPARFGTNRT